MKEWVPSFKSTKEKAVFSKSPLIQKLQLSQTI